MKKTGLLLLLIQVSAKGWIIADSRYQLYVDGQRIHWGPAPFVPRLQEAYPVVKTLESSDEDSGTLSTAIICQSYDTCTVTTCRRETNNR